VIAILSALGSDTLAGVAIMVVPPEDASEILDGDRCVQAEMMRYEAHSCHASLSLAGLHISRDRVAVFARTAAFAHAVALQRGGMSALEFGVSKQRFAAVYRGRSRGESPPSTTPTVLVSRRKVLV
jgi:hypothetical protein